MLKKISLNISRFLLVGAIALMTHYDVNGQNLSGIEGSPKNYTEGDGAVPITRSLVVNGSAPVSYATVTIENGYQADEDSLVFPGDAGIYPVFDEEAGQLLLLSFPANSTTTIAAVQAALRSVLYVNTNEGNPQSDPRTVSFTVYNQSNEAGNSVSRDIAVKNRNDAPVLRSPTNTPVVVNTLVTAVPISEDLQVRDVDNTNLVGARVDVNQARFSDQLDFTDNTTDNITIQRVDGSNTQLVLSGRDTKANYEAALRSIKIQNIFSARGFKGNRLVEIQVNDESGAASNQFFQYVHVADLTDPENVPPSISDLSVSINSNQILSFQPQQFQQAYNDTERIELNSIRILSLPTHGFLALDGVEVDADYLVRENGVVEASSLGSLAYVPNENFVGSDQFEWNATDGDDFAANPAYVSISVEEPAVPLLLEVPAEAMVNEDEVSILPVISLQASAFTPLDVSLSAEAGQVNISSVILSQVDVLDDEGNKLLFSGSAQVVRFVLSGLQYLTAPDATGNDLLNVSVTSLTNQEDGIMVINIVPVDDPVLISAIEPEPLQYIENSPPVEVTGTITLSDPDGTTAIKSATVTVPEGLNEEDELTYSLTGGVTAALNESEVVFTGEGSLSQYQTILRSVAYQNTSDDPQANSLSFDFQVIDENDSVSNRASRILQIVAVDDSTQLITAEPELLNYVLKREAIPIHASLEISDVDSDSLTRMIVFFEAGYDAAVDSILVTLPEGVQSSWDDNSGQLEISGENSLDVYQAIARSLRYQSTALEVETNRQIAIQVFNGQTPSNVLLRSVELVDNEPPSLSNLNKKVVQNGRLIFTMDDFLANYTDPDNSPTPDQFSSLRVITLPAHGVLSVANDTITQDEIEQSPDGFFLSSEDIPLLRYHPLPAYLGEDQWAWNAFDGAELAIDSAFVSITVVPALSTSLADSIEICPGETIELSVEVLSGESPYSFAWSCDQENCEFQSAVSEATVAITPLQRTQYVVQVISSEGLDSLQDTIVVNMIDCSDVPLEIPSAFTPNGDDINDVWVLPNAAIFSSVQIAIYDRFGNSLYESTNYQNNWDGTYQGKDLPMGSYYYTIVLPQELQEYKGTVTLLR